MIKNNLKLRKRNVLFILLIVIFALVIRFKILQPDTPIFRYNGSTFSVSSDIYDISLQNKEDKIWKATALGKSINKNSFKYLYKFNLNKELESYMVPSFSQIYCINDKPLKGKLSDVVLVEFEENLEYKGQTYQKGKFYIANRIK